ncbi:MAG: L-rhamnose mutarotase [Planctomycetota bacterium]
MRYAFRMSVHRDAITEYERRHNPIWPELEQVLIAHGVRSYSIFIDDADGSLFGFADIANRAQWDAIATTDVCRRWWTFMRDVMPTNADHSPAAQELREVFCLRVQ